MKKLIVLTIVTVFLFSFSVQAQSCCLPKTDKKVENASVNQQKTKTVTLKVIGMTCTGCSNQVYNALKKVDGVLEELVEYSEDKAVVTFNPKLTTVEAIIKAINKTPFTARLLKTKS